MPQALRSSASNPSAAIPLNGHYPKLLQGNSGSVWLITAPKTGVLLHLSNRPQKAKHKIGYYSTRMNEAKMREYRGNVTIAV